MDTQNTNKNTQRVATKSTKDNEAAKRAAMMGGAAILGGGAVAAANEIFDGSDHDDENLTPEEIASQVAGGGVAASATQGNSGHTGNGNNGNGNNGNSTSGQHAEQHENQDNIQGTSGSTGTSTQNTNNSDNNTGNGGNSGNSGNGGNGGNEIPDEPHTPEKPEEPEEPIDIDQIIVDGKVLPPEDPDLVAMEILDVEQVDDFDIDPDAVLTFDEIGTVYMVDGSEATQASFHLENGAEGLLVDTTGDGTFETITDGEFADSTEGTPFEMTVDDALLDMNPSPDYLAYDADNDHTDSLGEAYSGDIIS